MALVLPCMGCIDHYLSHGIGATQLPLQGSLPHRQIRITDEALIERGTLAYEGLDQE